MIAHATLIAAFLGGHWRGVLIEAGSGAGKSDLALRAMARGFRLVADDRVLLWASDGRLFGRAPDTLRGLIEVRGVGVLPVQTLNFAEVVLILRSDRTPERIPEPQTVTILGVSAHALDFAPLESSAVDKVAFALQHLGAGR